MFKKIKSFYIENMKLIHKFWLNQIAISLFGFVVILSTSAINKTFMIVSTVCAALFFCVLLYDSAWDEGARDRNKITNNRLIKRPMHGALVALFAYIPTMLFVIPTVVLTLLSYFGVDFVDYALIFFSAISIFVCNGMYMGFTNLLSDVFPNVYQLFFFTYFIPAIFAYWLGYLLGTEDKQIKTLFGMKPSTGAQKKPTQK